MYVGARRTLASIKGVAWAIREATLDLDLANARMAVSGNPTSYSNFVASYFTRGSTGWDTNLADPSGIDAYLTNVPRSRGDSLLMGPQGTRQSLNPQNPQAGNWTNSGSTLTNLAADGAWLPRRVASVSQSYNGLNMINPFTIVSGTPFSIRIRYRGGSSGKFRLAVFSLSAGSLTSLANGPVGAVVANGANLGPWSNIRNINLGGGLYELEATLTPNASATDAIVYLGPDSATAGQYVDVYGGQITNTPYPREWILGTAGSTQVVAQDVLRCTAAQAGVIASEGALFWRGVPLGFDPSSATRLLSSDQTTVTLSRVLFYIGTDGKAVVTINDDTNTTVAIATSAASVIGSDLTLGITWGAGSCRMKIGAASAVNDASAASPTGVTSLTIGSRIDNAGASLARHRRVVAIPRRLSDAEFDATFARIAA